MNNFDHIACMPPTAEEEDHMPYMSISYT